MSSHPIPTHLISPLSGQATLRTHTDANMSLKRSSGTCFCLSPSQNSWHCFASLPPLILVAYATKYKLYPFSLVCVGSAVCLLCISWIKRSLVNPVFPHHLEQGLSNVSLLFNGLGSCYGSLHVPMTIFLQLLSDVPEH